MLDTRYDFSWCCASSVHSSSLVTLFCDSCSGCFFCSKIWRECHNKWIERLRALFQRQPGNKGSLWSSGFALVWIHTPNRQTNFHQLLSQRVSVSSNGGNSCSYSFSRIIRGALPGIWKYVFLQFLQPTCELVSTENRGRWLEMIKYELFLCCLNLHRR